MEYVIRFAISLFDLAVFMYYFHSNKKMKPVSKVWILAGFTIAAIIWTFVSNIKNPYLNLATLLIVLILLSFYYESGMWTRIINIVTFMGIGMLFEPVALLLLHAMNFHMGESYKYYFVMVICSFVRGNVMYILSKLISKKGMQIAAFPKEILGVLVMVFTFTVLNCCFIILLSLEAGSEKSLLMCASIVISLVLTDYFMLYMMERFNYLVQKQYEDAMYREEMHYKDIYYEEAEKQNKEVQKLKHDMKHKLHELYHLVENSDGQELSEKIGAMCKEFEQIDEKQYSDNPIVDSVLRIKFGRAKARGIKVETSIRIPKQMQLDHGDIGVLYGNLVDNAVEACSKVPEGQRFVKIENKYQSGILLLVITNSKTGKKNKSLKTTKKDNIRHGHGVQSVRKVVEKYNGTVLCPKRRMVRTGECQQIFMLKSEAQDKVLEITKEICRTLIQEEELKKASKDKRKVTSDEYLISELKAEYDRISNSTVSCYQSYREGKYTKEEYVQLRKTNQELLADLENQISDLQEKVANQEPDAEEKIEQLTQYSMLEQYDGDVLSNIIDKVFIYNDKDIEIVFKGENFIRNAV